ncbi:MAG: aromatic ring-hydroxylating oxygenase subunit alpha [Trueperaceae bacterium]
MLLKEQIERPASFIQQQTEPIPTTIYTLPSDVYTSQNYFEKEKEGIWYKSWLYAGHVTQIPNEGDYFVFNLLGESLIVIKSDDGSIQAFSNVCRHRAHLLLKGTGTAKKVIVCPYHAWSYSRQGDFVHGRGCGDLKDFNVKAQKLPPVLVAVVEGLIFINFDSKATPFSDLALPLFNEIHSYVKKFSQFRFHKRFEHVIRGNWKVVLDNYLECYHCQPAHPSFSDLMDVKHYNVVTHKWYSSHIAASGREDNLAYHASPNEQDYHFGFTGWHLWPNLTINSFPGPANMLLYYAFPIDPNTTLAYCDYFFDKEIPTRSNKQMMEWETHILSGEDISLIESVQCGLHSQSYKRGRLMVDPDGTEISEHALGRFHELVRSHAGELE